MENKLREFRTLDELDYVLRVTQNQRKRPKNTLPLVWVKSKEGGVVSLVTGITETENALCFTVSNTAVSGQELLSKFKFLDGSPCGVFPKELQSLHEPKPQKKIVKKNNPKKR